MDLVFNEHTLSRKYRLNRGEAEVTLLVAKACDFGEGSYRNGGLLVSCRTAALCAILTCLS